MHTSVPHLRETVQNCSLPQLFCECDFSYPIGLRVDSLRNTAPLRARGFCRGWCPVVSDSGLGGMRGDWHSLSGLFGPGRNSFLGDLIAGRRCSTAEIMVLSFPSFSQFPSYFSDGGTTYSLPLKASLHGRPQNGHHRCRGRCNCVALHACDVPWFGPHVVLLGYLAYTTL